jgi:catechol 2,3-dioxygenase
MNRSSSSIDRLRALTVKVTDIDRSFDFYTNTWGLSKVADRKGSIWLRGRGVDHHVLVLEPGEQAGLVSITWGTESLDALNLLYEKLISVGVKVEEAPRKLGSPGGGWGFSFEDPDGNVHKVVALREDHADSEPSETYPLKLSHVVLNSKNAESMVSFFTDVLDFKISDQTKKMTFLRCNSDHHSIAVAQEDVSGLNHFAFEMQSWNELMFGAGRLKLAGYKIQWGIGRHGPGDNVFAYFLDPDGYATEYTAELQRITDPNHIPGKPEQWVRPPERMDQWAFSDLPSAAMKQAMHSHFIKQ